MIRRASGTIVLGALAQRRARDRHDVEPVVQVLAERAASRPSSLEVAVGRRDDAHVDRARSSAADALELARLEHAQQLGLRGQRPCSPISSRKIVPPSATSNRPRLPRDRAGERAALVAEQLALEQALAGAPRS